MFFRKINKITKINMATATDGESNAFVFIFDRRYSAAPELKVSISGIESFQSFKDAVKTVIFSVIFQSNRGLIFRPHFLFQLSLCQTLLLLLMLVGVDLLLLLLLSYSHSALKVAQP